MSSLFSEGYEERYEGDDGDDAHIVVSSLPIDVANTSLYNYLKFQFKHLTLQFVTNINSRLTEIFQHRHLGAVIKYEQRGRKGFDRITKIIGREMFG